MEGRCNRQQLKSTEMGTARQAASVNPGEEALHTACVVSVAEKPRAQPLLLAAGLQIKKRQLHNGQQKCRGASPEQLPAELKAADIFCLPSLEEGFPLSMLQAMASGLPVITTRETGAEDIIEPGVEGLVPPSKDSAGLTEALRPLVNNAEQRRQMSIAARRRVEQGFSWDDYIDRAIAAYHALVAAT